MYKKAKPGEGALTVAEARAGFAEVLNQVRYTKNRVVLTRHGKRVAAVVPIEDFDMIERLEDEIDLREARKALADIKKHGTIPWEKLKKKLNL